MMVEDGQFVFGKKVKVLLVDYEEPLRGVWSRILQSRKSCRINNLIKIDHEHKP